MTGRGSVIAATALQPSPVLMLMCNKVSLPRSRWLERCVKSAAIYQPGLIRYYNRNAKKLLVQTKCVETIAAKRGVQNAVRRVFLLEALEDEGHMCYSGGNAPSTQAHVHNNNAPRFTVVRAHEAHKRA
jgi:hypothetical protein